MKTKHLLYVLLVLFLQPIWSGAKGSTGDENGAAHRSLQQLSPGQQFQGLNATVKLSNDGSMREESEDFDPMRRLSHAGKGGSGGQGGGRSVGGGGSQSLRQPRSEPGDAPSLLLLSSSFTQIIFHGLLVSVLFF